LGYFFNKHESFESENEFRVVISQMPQNKWERMKNMIQEDWPREDKIPQEAITEFNDLFNNDQLGLRIPIESLKETIDFVYVNPGSDDNFLTEVKILLEGSGVDVIYEPRQPMF